MTPVEAFLLVLSGTLGVYCEFIRPGRVFPGLAGSVLAAAGIRGFACMQLTRAGMVLIGLAIALFLLEVFWLEAFWRANLLAGLAGIVSLTIGFCLLVRGPGGIPPALAIFAGISFGCLTLFLCCGAKRARRNKWSDVAPEQLVQQERRNFPPPVP